MECIAAGSVVGKRGIDWERVSASELDGVLKGEVARTRGGGLLRISLMKSAKDVVTSTVPLGPRGALPEESRRLLLGALRDALKPPPPPTPVATDTPPAAVAHEEASPVTPVASPPATPGPEAAPPAAKPPTKPIALEAADRPAPNAGFPDEPEPASSLRSDNRPRKYKPLPPELLSMTPRI
jgi:hypothetical protein